MCNIAANIDTGPFSLGRSAGVRREVRPDIFFCNIPQVGPAEPLGATRSKLSQLM